MRNYKTATADVKLDLECFDLLTLPRVLPWRSHANFPPKKKKTNPKPIRLLRGEISWTLAAAFIPNDFGVSVCVCEAPPEGQKSGKKASAIFHLFVSIHQKYMSGTFCIPLAKRFIAHISCAKKRNKSNSTAKTGKSPPTTQRKSNRRTLLLRKTRKDNTSPSVLGFLFWGCAESKLIELGVKLCA